MLKQQEYSAESGRGYPGYAAFKARGLSGALAIARSQTIVSTDHPCCRSRIHLGNVGQAIKTWHPREIRNDWW